MGISEQKFRELLDRYLNNTASQAERDLLDSFFDSYRTGMSDTHSPLEHNLRLQNEILQKIRHRIASSGTSRKNSRMRFWLPVAAVLSIFVLAYFFTNNSSPRGIPISESLLKEEQTLRGEKLLTKLPDGTEVTLNGETRISFPEAFGQEVREVTVTGEAYFQVVKSDKPFIVHLNGVKTEVLGTAFNVKYIPGTNVEVTLVEGSVNIVSQHGKSKLLTPHQQAIVSLHNADIETKNVNVLRYVSWKDNILYFEQTTLKEAVAILETWYDVDIEIRDPVLEACVITAKYQDEPLENVLSSFQFLLNLTITGLDERNITISGKGCK